MDGEWQTILTRYGRDVTLYSPQYPEGGALRAMVQPVLERTGEQQVPSPLGMRREDRFLYLGPKEAALQAGESQVVCQDGAYEVQSAHLVGDHHWWAILRPRDKESL